MHLKPMPTYHNLATVPCVLELVSSLPPKAKGYVNLTPMHFYEAGHTVFAGHLEQLLTVLGLKADSSIIAVKYENYAVNGVYVPCVVGSGSQLVLKIGASMLPIAVKAGEDQIENFYINEEIVTLESGISEGQNKKPFCKLTVDVTDTTSFVFGAVFNIGVLNETPESEVEELLKGLRISTNKRTQKFIVPSAKQTLAALNLLANWANTAGSSVIAKCGSLNEGLYLAYKAGFKPTLPLSFAIKRVHIKTGEYNGKLSENMLITVEPHTGQYADVQIATGNKDNVTIVPLSEITTFSFNKPLLDSNNYPVWYNLETKKDSVEGCYITVRKLASTVNHCPTLAFYDAATVALMVKEGNAASVLGLSLHAKESLEELSTMGELDENDPRIDNTRDLDLPSVDASKKVGTISKKSGNQPTPAYTMPIQDETAGEIDWEKMF